MSLYLVTGGAGFIGSHLVESLVRRSERVRILDDFSSGKMENLSGVQDKVEIIEGDIRNIEQVQQSMNGVDYVLHHAAIVSPPQSVADPLTTHAVNVNGTLNVLLAAHHAKVKRFVFASSCSVYGDNDDLPLKETAAARPLSPYAASKLAGEMCCLAFNSAYGLPTVCLRYFNVYGPRQNPNGEYAAVIPRFIARIKAGQSPIIYGDGLQTRDFVHVSDVVRANLLVCERQEAIGQIFNVASQSRISLLDLVEIFSQLAGKPLTPLFQSPRAGDVVHSVGDNDRITAALGFQISTPLVEGLRQVMTME